MASLGATNYTFIAIASAFLAAISNIIARTLLKNLKSKDFIGVNFLIMSSTLLLFSPSFYYFDVSFISISLLVLISVIDLIANYFYFKSFEKSEASYVTPLLSLSPFFSFIFGWLFISESINLMQFLIALSIIVCIIIFSYDNKSTFIVQKETLLSPIIASILFGLSAIPSKFLLGTLHAMNPPTLYMLRGSLIGLFALMFFTSNLQNISLFQYKMIFVRGLFVIAQFLLFYYALIKGSVGVTMTLVNITPIFVFILGMLFLREKPTLKKAIASILVIVLSFLL